MELLLSLLVGGGCQQVVQLIPLLLASALLCLQPGQLTCQPHLICTHIAQAVSTSVLSQPELNKQELALQQRLHVAQSLTSAGHQDDYPQATSDDSKKAAGSQMR